MQRDWMNLADLHISVCEDTDEKNSVQQLIVDVEGIREGVNVYCVNL